MKNDNVLLDTSFRRPFLEFFYIRETIKQPIYISEMMVVPEIYRIEYHSPERFERLFKGPIVSVSIL